MNIPEVLKLLRRSKPTLYWYLKKGLIQGKKLVNGRYDFNEKSIYSFLHKDVPRKNYIYERILKKEVIFHFT